MKMNQKEPKRYAYGRVRLTLIWLKQRSIIYGKKCNGYAERARIYQTDGL